MFNAQDGGPRVHREVPVTATDLLSRPSNNSPSLAVDPTDERFVVETNRLDAPFDCALHVSGDGGRGWVRANPVPQLPAGAEACYGPDIAFDAGGRLYFLFVGLAGSGNRPVGVFLTRSDDRGQTFSEPRKVLGRNRYMVALAMDRSVGQYGRLHLAWLEARGEPSLGGLPPPPNPIMAQHSEDGGESFSEPVQVSDPSREHVVAPALAMGPNNAIHIAYYDLEDDVRDYQGLEGPVWEGNWSLVVASSFDGGKSFGSGVEVNDELVPPERVMLIFTMAAASLAADDSGHVYVGWHDGRHGDWDAFVSRSRDAGTTWDKPVRVHDDTQGNGRHQYLPQVSVAPNGRVDTVFYDRRNSSSNLGNDVYYTYSVDRGATFAENLKLNTLSSFSRIGPRYAVPSARGLIEFGGRLAVVSGETRVVAAWTDTTKTERGAPAQDITATTVEFPGGSARIRRGLQASALVLVAVLLLGLAWRAWRRTRLLAVPTETVG